MAKRKVVSMPESKRDRSLRVLKQLVGDCNEAEKTIIRNRDDFVRKWDEQLAMVREERETIERMVAEWSAEPEVKP